MLVVDPAARPDRSAKELALINNSGSDQIVGTLTGLDEAVEVPIGGAKYAITYKGGDGNDVTLNPPR